MSEIPPKFQAFNQQGVGKEYAVTTDVLVRPPLDGDMTFVGQMLGSVVGTDQNQRVTVRELTRVGDTQHMRVNVVHGLAPADSEAQTRMLTDATEALKQYHTAVALGDLAALKQLASRMQSESL